MSATTVMKDSEVGDAWIQQTAAAVPVQRVIDPQTGQPTGDILTGPVRLMFPNLFERDPKSKNDGNPEGKYNAQILFTPYVDFTILYEEYNKVCMASFPEHLVGGQWAGLHSPFRDQAQKLKFQGYTPGCIFMSVSTQYKPPVVDANRNPVVDPGKVYPGVWAICAVNAYAIHDPRKKGCSFGLQSVMLIGDDTNCGGGGVDPRQTFGGVTGISRPTVSPSAVAGMPTGARPPGAPGMPPPPAGGTYAAPTGAPAPAPAGAPPVSYAAPPAPAYAPPPAADPRGPVPAGFATWAEYDELMG